MAELRQEDLLPKLWDAEQDILNVVHEFCEKHGLKYSLAYGTLIGAVRHSGFIPWDDDIDIMMPREDFDRLLSLWDIDAPEGYILETKELNKDIVNNHAKIRKNHTTFLQFESERKRNHHKGIFIDIFPVDRVAPGKVARAIQYAAFAVSILYCRGYISGAGKKSNFIGNTLLRATPKKLYYPISSKAESLGKRWNNQHQTMLMATCTMSSCRHYYPSDIFDHLIKMQFRGQEYYAFRDYDTVLRIEYNDYMQLPPEEERTWKHHPIILDFEHNYEELDEAIRNA